MGQQGPQEQTPATVQIIAAAIMASNVIYMLVLGLLRVTGSMPANGFVGIEGQDAVNLTTALGIAAFAVVAGSIPMRKRLEQIVLDRADTRQSKTRIIIVTMAVCDVAGIMGLWCGLLTGKLLWAGLLAGIGLIGCAHHFPTRAWLEACPGGEEDPPRQ